MKGFVAGVIVTLAAGAALGAGIAYLGMVDVSADTPHSSLVYRLIETTRDKAIDARVRDLQVPADLRSDERIRRGAGNYDAMCVECHLAPGKANSEIRAGLYPQPPDLTQPAGSDVAARHFWVIKHGIKASGMPAWSRGGIEDEAIWDLVAFLQKMPTLNADQYGALVEASDGHSHGGIEGDAHGHGDSAADAHESTDSVPDKPVKKRHDPNDGHAH